MRYYPSCRGEVSTPAQVPKKLFASLVRVSIKSMFNNNKLAQHQMRWIATPTAQRKTIRTLLCKIRSGERQSQRALHAACHSYGRHTNLRAAIAIARLSDRGAALVGVACASIVHTSLANLLCQAPSVRPAAGKHSFIRRPTGRAASDLVNRNQAPAHTLATIDDTRALQTPCCRLSVTNLGSNKKVVAAT